MGVLKAKVGGAWVEVPGVGAWVDVVPWNAVTFQNSWVNFGSGYQDAQYRKVGDIVYIRGWVKGGAAGVAMFTLPAGYRPPAYVHFPAEANDKFGVMRVGPGGDVLLLIGDVTTHVAINNVIFSVTP